MLKTLNSVSTNDHGFSRVGGILTYIYTNKKILTFLEYIISPTIIKRNTSPFNSKRGICDISDIMEYNTINIA